MSDTPRRDGPSRDGRPAGGSSSGGRSTGGRAGGGRPAFGRAAGGRPASGNSDAKRPARAAPNHEKRLWTKGGAPARGDRDSRQPEGPEDRDPFGIRSVRAYHEAPEIPDDVTPKQLDRVALNELKTLSKENAEGVARHLVMAARLIEDDPQRAHSHAVSAARRAFPTAS